MGKMTDFINKKKAEVAAEAKLGKATAALRRQKRAIGTVRLMGQVERVRIQNFDLTSGDWIDARGGGSKWRGTNDEGEKISVNLTPKGPYQFVRTYRQDGRLYLECDTVREGTVLLYVGKKPHTSSVMKSITVEPYTIRRKVRRPARPILLPEKGKKKRARK